MNMLLNRRFWNTGNPLAWIVAVLVVLLLGVMTETWLRSACLAHGFPEVRRSPFAPTYCIKRENNTDLVVRLRDLEAR